LKLTKPGQNGASQLNSSVGPTDESSIDADDRQRTARVANEDADDVTRLLVVLG
jgi:hypothetical protein